jgi:hypothetical protein
MTRLAAKRAERSFLVPSHREVKAKVSHTISEVDGAAVRGICEHDAARHLRLHGSPNHVEGELRLGPELQAVGHMCFSSALLVIGPRERHVQLKIDGRVIIASRDTQAHGDLAVRDLACRA